MSADTRQATQKSRSIHEQDSQGLAVIGHDLANTLQAITDYVEAVRSSGRCTYFSPSLRDTLGKMALPAVRANEDFAALRGHMAPPF